MTTPKRPQPYRAVLHFKTLLRPPGRRSAFKVYFISLTGRQDRARYEWSLTPEAAGKALQALAGAVPAGAGFIVAFRHIVKIFRFDPALETVLNVRAFKTDGLAPLDLKRAEDYLEFACLAEAILAADEYRLWAGAQSVEEYLANFSRFSDCSISSVSKLAAFTTGAAS